MKQRCLKCGIVVDITGEEFEQKVSIFNSYMHGASDYLNLFSLTGGDCNIVDNKNGNKHFFEFEDETEREIGSMLSSYLNNEKKKQDRVYELDIYNAKKDEIESKLGETQKLIDKTANEIDLISEEMMKSATNFTKITGIKHIEKWR